MQVLLAKKGDRAGIVRLLLEDFFDSKKEAEKCFLENLKKKQVWVLEDKKVILGVFAYTRAYSHEANYLEYIAVDKKYRGNGLSKKLLERYIRVSKKEQSAKQRFVLSSTKCSNLVSIRMHLDFGFKQMGVLKKLHYGEDEIIFAYPLRK
ncbi:MAG: GNAT family N-acetyltransferase [Candidatus Nanoarchaeia archaeon]